MNVLVVEDEEPKRRNILLALGEIAPDAQPSEARSVSSAIGQLRKAAPDLLLLDMSLPTFDIRPGEAGGRPQGFGGIEVLRYMDRFNISTPVVVVTAYEAFPKDGRQIDLDALTLQLSGAHPATFRGVVFYNSVYAKWREDLAILVNKALAR